MIPQRRAARPRSARRQRTFRAAATKFLEENQHKRSLEREPRSLTIPDPYIGALPLRRVHHDTRQPYERTRLESGRSPGTVNRDLWVVRRILNLSARIWRDETDWPWLDTAPLIQMQRHPNKREPYSLSNEEQRLLFLELHGHLAAMALFKVNTGLREREVVNLRLR
jgi:integrase